MRTKDKIKKSLLLIIITFLAITYLYGVMAKFIDIDGYDWAKEYIEELEERGIVSGTSVTTFSPGKNVKREEFVKIIVCLFEYGMDNAECEFDDVKDSDWFYPYVASATKAGIINGVGNNKFGTGQYITRQDICTILYRALKDNGYKLNVDDSKTMSFDDVGEINSYAYEAMEQMYQAGVINGIDESHVSPKSYATRAQMVKMACLSDKQKEIDTQIEKRIVLNKSGLSLKIGEKEVLKATVKPNETAEEIIEWSSSNTKVAIVKNGEVEGKREGTVTITAKIKKTNILAECEVTVVKDDSASSEGSGGGTPSGGTPSGGTPSGGTPSGGTPSGGNQDESGTSEAIVNVTGISLNKTNITLTKGNRETLTAIIQPDNATNKNVKWESNDSTIAGVNGGMITGLKAGTTTVTATTVDGNKKASCIVKVENPPETTIPVTGITLNKTSLTLTVGKSELLSASIQPDNATNKNMIWGSNNSSIATVTNGGKVTAVKAGITTIIVTAEDGLKTATCTVKVEDPAPTTIAVTGVTLNKTSMALDVGESEVLQATVAPTNATNKNITWSSSNTSVAIVSNGKVTGAKAGTATVTATTADGAKKATCTVTVKAATVAVTGVTLNKTSMNLTVGGSETLTATVIPTNVTNKNVTWSSSNTNVATVTEGKVTAIGVGESTITVTTQDGSKKASCKVTTFPAKSSITLNKTSLDIDRSKKTSYTLKATVVLAQNATLSWSSSKKSIVTVTGNGNNGVLNFVGNGEAVITAKTTDGVKATCNVKVTETGINAVLVNSPAIYKTYTISDSSVYVCAQGMCSLKVNGNWYYLSMGYRYSDNTHYTDEPTYIYILNTSKEIVAIIHDYCFGHASCVTSDNSYLYVIGNGKIYKVDIQFISKAIEKYSSNGGKVIDSNGSFMDKYVSEIEGDSFQSIFYNATDKTLYGNSEKGLYKVTITSDNKSIAIIKNYYPHIKQQIIDSSSSADYYGTLAGLAMWKDFVFSARYYKSRGFGENNNIKNGIDIYKLTDGLYAEYIATIIFDSGAMQKGEIEALDIDNSRLIVHYNYYNTNDRTENKIFLINLSNIDVIQ